MIFSSVVGIQVGPIFLTCFFKSSHNNAETEPIIRTVLRCTLLKFELYQLANGPSEKTGSDFKIDPCSSTVMIEVNFPFAKSSLAKNSYCLFPCDKAFQTRPTCLPKRPMSNSQGKGQFAG